MSPIHLIRARLATRPLARWAGERGWTGGRFGGAFDQGRALHHLVDEMFGPGVLRPFRLLVPPRRSEGNLYAYSALDGPQLQYAAHVQAKPDHLLVLPLDRLDSKPMPDNWTEGQRVGFDVRVRPVRRVGKPIDISSGTIPAGSELDAFVLEAIRCHPDDAEGMRASERGREEVYLDWLSGRLHGAAELERDATRLVRFHRTVASRGRGAVEGPDAVVHGTLTILNREAFAQLLARGIGRHRAYGYGMLLLSAPGRPAPDK